MKSHWIFCAVLLVTTCASQTSPPTRKKALPKAQPTPSRFTCPDPEAIEGCKSYEELVKAKDAGVAGQGAYVCFRKKTDEFFVVWFWKRYFRRKWDGNLKQLVLDTEATYSGQGFATSYRNGVADQRVMPSIMFTGTWSPLGEGFFSADKINGKEKDENDQVTGIFIDETQFAAAFKYPNAAGKTIEYSLTIQRSTGRFTESYREESEKLPFSEDTGRCIYRK